MHNAHLCALINLISVKTHTHARAGTLADSLAGSPSMDGNLQADQRLFAVKPFDLSCPVVAVQIIRLLMRNSSSSPRSGAESGPAFISGNNRKKKKSSLYLDFDYDKLEISFLLAIRVEADTICSQKQQAR